MSPRGTRVIARWHDFVDELREVAEQGASLEALAELRRARTRNDPALFALVYLSKHLADDDGRVTLSDTHAAWAKSAQRWSKPVRKPMSDRRAEVAPREMGKSTWWFLLLPMWAAAHGHVRFAAAFADSDTQAQTHLASFKSELDNNALIRNDYPLLVQPKTRGRGQVEADRVSLYHARSGFVFAAAGADSRNLGLKVEDQRPDLLIIDDIEPHEGAYGSSQVKKRLSTLLDAIFPLNIRAHVIISGTVTMTGSIVHQVVAWGRGERTEENAWVGENRIRVRHTPAILVDDDGKRRSVWPAKWPLSFLESIEHTRSYRKNYANDPLGADGDYWQLEDIEKAQTLGRFPGITRIVVSVDPAVTSKAKSDYTGIAVIGWTPPPRERPKAPGRCTVLEVRQVKKSGAKLRLDVIDTVARWNAGLVLVEVNQGHDLWHVVFWGMPVNVKTMTQSEAKEVRAAGVLDHYQRGRVGHAPECAERSGTLTDFEGQLVAFPNAPHDDMVDAAGSGVSYFLDRHRRKKGVAAGGSTEGYAA